MKVHLCDEFFKEGFIAGFTETLRGERSEKTHVKLLIDGKEIKVHLLKQVHSAEVIVVEEKRDVGDALISLNGEFVGVKTADCVPVVGFDPSTGLTFAVHAGWRGIAKGIVESTLKKLREMGACFQEIRLFIGPHICQGHYEVGDDLRRIFSSRYSTEVFRENKLSLLKCVLEDLSRVGIREDKVSISPLCTYETHFLPSYRRDGKGCGRMITFAGRYPK